MMDLDDGTLVQRFKSSRNADCFSTLFLRYGRRVFALAYAFYKDYGHAEDCMQETFLRAFVEIDKYDETIQDSHFWAWLQTIARNICIDELRRRQRRPAFAEPRDCATDALTQEEALMVQELRDRLKALPPKSRMSYLLSADGYSYKEIMDLTGFSYDQVKTFIQTAKRYLVREFQ